MIATHNSGTGEKGSGWLSKLVTPFARCQSKSIADQYWAGCRLFDLRAKYVDGKLVIAHGLWHSDRTLWDIISQLYALNKDDLWKVNILVTYEGECEGEKLKLFVNNVKNFCAAYDDRVSLGYIAVKKPKWKTVWLGTCPQTRQGFQTLEKMPHCLLPIPWLWNLIKHDEFDGKEYVLLDFL